METTLDKDFYLARWAKLDKADRQPAWLKELRQAAIQRYAELGFPTTRLEEWQFTNVRAIAGTHFEPAAPPAEAPTVESLERQTFADPSAIRVVFVNGRLSKPLSTTGLPKGVAIMSLCDAIQGKADDVRRHLGRHARYEHHAFAALNTALFEDGAYVHVDEGVVVEQPIHMIFAATPGNRPWVCHPRILIVAERSSQLRIVESYVGRPGVYLTNAVTEVVAAENAVVDHYKLQRESLEAWHMASLEFYAAASAAVSNHTMSFGAAIARNDIGAVLDGPGADAVLNGLFVVAGDQHCDNHTSIDHAKPHGTSHELYKGVLDGKARSVFNGRIRVRIDAQKTDSKQTNKNLLLSDEALVNTNPQLEIYADDVKCTHGATIGQLDETALFYLRSRGINEAMARQVLTYAFANDVVERIKLPALRDRLTDDLAHRLRHDDGGEEEMS